MKAAHHFICPLCEVRELEPHGRASAICPHCGRLGAVFLKTLRRYARRGFRYHYFSSYAAFKKERDDDLLWWSDLVDHFLEVRRTVFGYANNHYQNPSPSTLARFLELRREVSRPSRP